MPIASATALPSVVFPEQRSPISRSRGFRSTPASAGADGAAEARAWRWHPTQTLEDLPDGRVEVRFTASGLRELAWHLFTWGEQVEIVSPERLKAVMAAELEAARRGLDRVG